ncbi:MAG: GNAT family N-acetyltransferase [Roseburia sp.]|nr:GNAT family N-acetyltransferase [Roseburia sp.]
MKTKRLFIRELAADDWMELKNISENFGKSKYSIYDMPLPVEDEKIKSLCEQFAVTGLWFSVMLDEIMIGYICFHESNGTYDLGFCFHSAYHGRGYACESCAATMKYIAKQRKADIFTAGTALKNIPACKLLKKLGFILEGTETLSFHKDENGHDILFEGGHFVKKEAVV